MNVLRDVHISGDFFFYPANLLPELEHALNGVPADTESVKAAVEKFYAAAIRRVPRCSACGYCHSDIPCCGVIYL